MVVALVLLPALASTLGGVPEPTDEPGGALGTLARTLGKVGLFVALMLVVGKRVFPVLLASVARVGSRELFTVAVLATAMGVAYFAAALFHVSLALGAFFAGMIVRGSDFSHQIGEDTLPLGDAFAVLFFVSVGMLFNPRVLWEAPGYMLATVGIILVGKSLAAMVYTSPSEADAMAYLEDAAKLFRGRGINPTLVHKLGDPAEMIIEVAEEWRPELIVMGSHGRTGIKRFLLGSVSEKVIRHAPCSVLISRGDPFSL